MRVPNEQRMRQRVSGGAAQSSQGRARRVLGTPGSRPWGVRVPVPVPVALTHRNVCVSAVGRLESHPLANSQALNVYAHLRKIHGQIITALR